MELTVEVYWKNSQYDYLVGTVIVRDKSNKILMYDEDMYWNTDKLQTRLNSLFFNNERFRWYGATYHKRSRKLVVTGVDLKGEE